MYFMDATMTLKLNIETKNIKIASGLGLEQKRKSYE